MISLVLIVVLLVVVVVVVSAPLRRPPPPPPAQDAATCADLEASREAKFREIRDAELDLRTGKLSADDYGTLDRQLRAEAIEILRQLDALGPAEPGARRVSA